MCIRDRLSTSNEARPRERRDRGRFSTIGIKASSYRGAYGVPLFNQSVCLCRCVYVKHSSFLLIARDVRGRFPQTRDQYVEAGECGRRRGTCFIARRLEVVAVAGLLWISWCVLGAAGFFCFFFLRTHTACCKYEAALLHLPLY